MKEEEGREMKGKRDDKGKGEEGKEQKGKRRRGEELMLLPTYLSGRALCQY